MKYASILLLAWLITPLTTQAQFGGLGKKLKQRAQEVLDEKGGDLVEEGQDMAEERMAEKQAEFDTTSFNYAIAFLDKSESFENQQKGEQLVRTAGLLLPKEATDLDKARDLYERGRALYNTRNYLLSEKHLEAAIVAFIVLEETEHPVFLKSVGTLGLLFNNMGRYDLADTANAFALHGWKKNLGRGSRGYAAEYNNKAVIAFNKGEYNEAETLFNQALRLIEQAEGPQSVPFAVANNNLGILYQHMGRSQEALKNVNRCLEIVDKELREKSGTYIQLMTNKALVLQENGQYDEAETTYQKAVDLQTSRLKLNRKSDPDYAHLLNNLASLYATVGKNDKVEPLLLESLEIYTTKFGQGHPSTSAAKADLGNFYRSQGQFPEAKELLQSAYQERKSSLGSTHPVTIESQEDLAIVEWLSGNISEAKNHYDQVMDYSLSFINDFFPPMSEVEKTRYWEKMKSRFDTFYSYALANHQQEPDLLEKLINYRLATKGLLLNTTTKIKQTILSSGDDELIELYNQWQDQKRSLAIYYSFSKEEITRQNVNLDSLQKAANESERQLSARSAAFAEAGVSKEVNYQDVVSTLGPDEAILEMIHLPVFDRVLTGSHSYVAVILKPGATPIVATLDNGDELDKKYFSYYKNAIRNRFPDEYSYQQYWAPLSGHLVDKSKIYFSADGVYHQLNLNTLRKTDGKYLIQDKSIRLIGNPRDLLASKETKELAKDAFLLGFPVYGSKDIVPLPGTQVELEQVKSTLQSGRFQVTDVTQREATEETVKSLQSPSIVHIATHGFFLQDVQSRGTVFGVQVEYAKSNPLLRSGLMLAGASSSNNASFSNQENGTLTAYEASNLQLDDTDLVVLSACETGQGDIKSGEGVYGLQRAFAVAGADKIIMSLWKVDDEATQQLMSKFYENWIGEGQGVAEAFRSAQLQLMEQRPDPYYWGAFVVVAG